MLGSASSCVHHSAVHDSATVKQPPITQPGLTQMAMPQREPYRAQRRVQNCKQTVGWYKCSRWLQWFCLDVMHHLHARSRHVTSQLGTLCTRLTGPQHTVTTKLSYTLWCSSVLAITKFTVTKWTVVVRIVPMDVTITVKPPQEMPSPHAQSHHMHSHHVNSCNSQTHSHTYNMHSHHMHSQHMQQLQAVSADHIAKRNAQTAGTIFDHPVDGGSSLS